MALRFGWRLEARACQDERAWTRQSEHWVQVAQAVEYAGLDHLYLPGGSALANGLMIAAALCAHTRRLGLSLAIPAEAMLPAALAATLQSLQSLSNGRAGLHLPDSDRDALRCAFGELLNRDQRHQRLDEFLQILRALLHHPAASLDHRGRYFQLENAGLGLRALPAPPLLLDASLGAERIAAQADVCLLQGATPGELAQRLEPLREAALHKGRQVGFACRFGVISRDTEGQAWDAAARQAGAGQWAWRDDPGGLALVAERAEHPARRREVHPGIWQPHEEEPAVLVGSHAQVASRLRELHRLGLDLIILQAEDPVGEVLRFGERVLPLLQLTRES